MPLSNTQVKVGENTTADINAELKRLPTTLGLTRAVISMRWIFREIARSAGQSHQKYVSVIITDGKANDILRLATEVKLADTAGIDIIIVGKLTYG